MVESIKYGVIGLGFFGEIHAEVLSSLCGVKLSAVSTRRPERLRWIAETYNVNKTYTDYKKLLTDEEIQAVSIVTHVDNHKEIAIAALNAGKHVFLEKPMAGNVEDCNAIIKAADSARGKFMVGHICRFDPRVSLARQAVQSGRIGKIISIHATRNLPANIGAEVLGKISPLMGDGIHDIDIMLWLTGEKVKTVYARNVKYRDFKNPDGGWAMLNFESGAVGVVETLWCLPENTSFSIDARMEIIGTEGAIYIDCGNAGVTVNDSNGIKKPDSIYWPKVAGKRCGALRTELEYFTECIRSDISPSIITPQESREAVTVVSAAEKSAKSGNVEKL